MLARYVWRDLVRNPRRTLAALVGVVLGVGLFSAILFFVDGSGASMTRRALAPLALDMQRVLTAPLGRGLELTERLSPSGRLPAGASVRVTLTVANRSGVPGHEVVVEDRPAAPLTYVPGTTTLNGRAVHAVGGGIPLSQGLAGTGLNIGMVPPGRTIRLAYRARAPRSLDTRDLVPQARISSREDVTPAPANAPSQLPLDRLAARVARIPGVVAADGLGFVDLPAGALSSSGAAVRDPVRVFAFNGAYQRHYPSVRLVSGALEPGRAALSAEAARRLGARRGATVRLRLPGRRAPLRIPVGAVADLSRARPLFYSRRASDLEAFDYVPDAVVVDPATFRDAVLPAFRAAGAARGTAVKSVPVRELDVLVARGRLNSDPGSALAQTAAIARQVGRIAPGQGYLIDNISNALQVARDDAAVAKRMFLFLGLPGALLAAFLAAYSGSILAGAQRREQANLRIRGAHGGHLLRMLIYRTLALAGAGSLIGTLLGLLSVMAILGPATVSAAAPGQLAVSALIGIALGMLATGVALYVPGHRSLRREISQERGELPSAAVPAWRRLRLDFVLIAVTAAGEIVALRTGAFDAPAGSVYEGRAVSVPSHLLLGPLGIWVGGVLLFLRLFDTAASRIRVPAAPRFGPPVWGSLTRSLRRRSWSLAGGMASVGLVVAFGTSLAVFAATYDAAKAADARFTTGSDLRVTPSAAGPPRAPGFAAALEVGGVAAATPVVSKLYNAVLTSSFNEDRESLAAIDPAGFRRVAALSDAFFVGQSAARTLSALQSDPRSVLIAARTADDLHIVAGQRVKLLLARGTRHQTQVDVRVAGLFTRFPGFPQGVNVVADLGFYVAATQLHAADFFLLRSTDPGPPGLARAVGALRAGPGRHDAFTVDTTRTTLDKDQSSLTALNVRGLLHLDALYTLLMAAAGIGIFVFGLMLQRRREYVTMRAQGMQTRELRALVLGETAAVTVCGLGAGLLVGGGMGYLFVRVLRPLFILDPGVTLSIPATAALAALILAATLTCALAATALLRRLRPTELLREA